MSLSALPVGEPSVADQNAPSRAKTSRRPDLDVLRVLCIILLIIFHSAMPFNAFWDWFVVDKERSLELLEFSFFVSRWRMGLLYTIAGIGTWFSLRRARPRNYLKSRAKRLLIPVVVASLVLVPPQVWVERVTKEGYKGSVWDFILAYRDLRGYPEGNWSWHHMWFVAYLFVYSVMLLPIFVWLRDHAKQELKDRLVNYLASPKIYLLAVPMGLFYSVLIQEFHGPPDIVRDWAMFLVYGCTFFYGYLIADNQKVWDALVRRRFLSLVLAFLLLVYVNYHRWKQIEPEPGFYPGSLMYEACLGMMPWYFSLGILGFGHKYITRAPKWLPYGNEAAYPVYVLHQTIVVGLGYFLVQTSLPVLVKFAILAVSALILTIGTYHVGVRPFPAMRFLFGMKPARADSTSKA